MAVQYDLKGRRVLVMGASSGVGREVALAACRAGARVALAARRRDKLEAAVARAEGEALAVPCDTTSSADCERALAEVEKAFGGVDALIYSAGLSPLMMLDRAQEEPWRRVLETNVMGASLITAAALPALRNSGGRALYVSSYSVRQVLPGLSLYRVSKVALDALIECWRVEFPEVGFTRLVVGNTSGTEFANGWDPDETRRTLEEWARRKVFPSNTMMSLDVLAEAVLSVLAVRGYVDDIAIMPHAGDATMESPHDR